MADRGDSDTTVDLDPSYREAFEFMDSETRVDILLVLAADMRERLPGESPGLSFSTLRERVGVRDSGRFNYHLGKLTGHLVRKVDDQYTLTIAGMQAVSTLVAGAFAAGERREPTTLDEDCPTCGATVTASYEAGALEIDCEESPDHGASYPIPPGAAEGRTLEELLDVMRVVTHHELGMTVQEVCPMCRGSFQWTTDPEESHDGSTTYFGHCERCSALYSATAGMLGLQDPSVVGFFHDHGVDVRERHVWQLGNRADERARPDGDGIEVTYRAGDDAIRVVLDGAARVVESDRVDPV